MRVITSFLVSILTLALPQSGVLAGTLDEVRESGILRVGFSRRSTADVVCRRRWQGCWLFG